jgi:formylglycine-generating enzyme required for sulfatase activity
MNRSIVGLILCFVSNVAVASNISIDTVPVAAVPAKVDYDYRIGTYEVTNAQYAAFLNAKAASDPHQLFNPNMTSFASGGITRTGSDGAYSYTTKPNMADKPVNFVSWYDSARFVNWLNNGQGDGNTENGAYLLTDSYLDSYVNRTPGATWVLPNGKEWAKAAFYERLVLDLPDGSELVLRDNWHYATRSDTVPALATADSAGNITNPGNVVNYANGADWNGLDGNVTTVGSGGSLSASPYGTYDQAGNVKEWGEAYNIPDFGIYEREYFGGGFRSTQYQLGAGEQSVYADTASDDLGFRVAQIVAVVPEPSSFLLSVVGLLALAICARRRTRCA